MAGPNPPLHALLVGIDRYDQPAEPGAFSYPDLAGCVRDVERVAAFLTGELGVPEQRVRRLTAPLGGGEAPADSPTYPNIVAAWRALGAAAAPGEQVWIHYSGHGGRVPTSCPEAKGEAGLDEVLVPTDIGDPQTRYLRDTEIAVLLREMTAAGLLVTLVLDSCHSGGAARGRAAPDVRPRGTDRLDTTPRPSVSLVAPPAELASNWRQLTARRARNLELASGWLPAPRGYVLLAACRAQEQALESTWKGGERGGALTHYFLDTVRKWTPGYTWEELHGRVRSKVIGRFETQTPQLEGERDRLVFGSEERAAMAAVGVLRVDGDRVLLNTGKAQAVRKGMRFAVYPERATDLRNAEGRLAVVEVREPGATWSWAEVCERLGEAPIVEGMQAVLAKVTPRAALKVLLPDGAGDAVRRALEEDDRGFVVPVDEVETADFTAGDTDGEWVIRAAGGAVIAGQDPAPRVGEEGAARILAQRLVHLAKFRNVRRLANHDPLSPLRGKLLLRLHRLGEGYEPPDPPELLPLETNAGAAEVRIGDELCLELQNTSKQVLNVVLLDLKPDWGISQVYPPKALGAFLSFDPGQRELILPLRAGLAEGMTAGSDVLKAFATVDAAPFSWLELPPLHQAQRAGRTPSRPPANPLEELFSALAFDGPGRRSLELVSSAGYEWTTEAVEIRVRR